MKKVIKWILGLGTVGTAVGLLTVRLIKKSKNISSDTQDDFATDTEGETGSDSFDLDQDLEPAQERSYVSLHASGQSENNAGDTNTSENTEVPESKDDALSGDAKTGDE